jgi:hypothetical protein
MGLCAVIIINRVYQVRRKVLGEVELGLSIRTSNIIALKVELELSASANHLVQTQMEQCWPSAAPIEMQRWLTIMDKKEIEEPQSSSPSRIYRPVLPRASASSSTSLSDF